MKGSDLQVTRWHARFHGRKFPCSVGRGGIRAAKKEGDGATPAGRFRLLAPLWRPGRTQGSAGSWIRPFCIWSDDPEDPAYNRMRSFGLGYRFSHERLRRPDPIYDLIVPVAYNLPDPVPGRGSAIFLHIWRSPRHPTAGCVAFAPDDLAWIVERTDDRTWLVTVPD